MIPFNSDRANGVFRALGEMGMNMLVQAIQAGLTPRIATPALPGRAVEMPTEEAALVPMRHERLRLDMLVAEEDRVAQGAPVARLRDHPEVALVAPMPARVARIRLGPGRQLVEIVFFREDGAGHFEHEVAVARRGDDPAALREVMQASGLWRSLRSRPFGHVPSPGEVPAAIFVSGADTRPLAADPGAMLAGREEDFLRGLAALGHLTDGPVCLSQGVGASLTGRGAVEGRLEVIEVGTRHPHGLAGFQVHRRAPASVDAPVWDLHAEDAADLGTLLHAGHMPGLRTVSVAGPVMTEARLLRCQAGANLRGLCHGAVRPGSHLVLSGSPLDGHAASWLGARDRQVSVLERHAHDRRGHWFRAALSRAARPLPIIPSAALEQALGGALPAAALVRALASGDDETLVKLGGLSLLEEDLALADYVTAAEPRLGALLRAALDRIEAEEAA